MAQGGLDERTEGERARALRRAEWRGRVEAWRGSGLTQAEYCRRQGLKPADFSWWKRELLRTDAVRQSGPVFVPVNVTGHVESATGCEVVLLNGRRLRIGSERDVGFIGQLVAALEMTVPPAEAARC